jgi:hypothetical protein
MKDPQTFFICFGIFNLCLLIFCRQLSGLVIGFFSIGRVVCPPAVAQKRAAKMGFDGFFADPKMFNPTRSKATQLLAWTGAVNFLGCIGFYAATSSGLFEDTKKPNKSEQATPRKPSD